MRKIFKAIMSGPFSRRKGQTHTPPFDPEFWRSPEATPIKKQRIEERWGPGTIPTILIYDLAPLNGVGFDDTVQLAQQFYGEPKYRAGNITFRASLPSEGLMTCLIVKQAAFLHLELTLQNHRLPLFKASHRIPGRSGSVLEFQNLRPDAPEAPRKSR